VREPQFRDEAGKADEQRRVEQALGAEQWVAQAMYPPKLECHDEDGRRIAWRSRHDGFSVDAPSCPVAEAEHGSKIPLWLGDVPADEQPHRCHRAAHQSSDRGAQWERWAVSDEGRLGGRAWRVVATHRSIEFAAHGESPVPYSDRCQNAVSVDATRSGSA
jgi:hypothetical protein